MMRHGNQAYSEIMAWSVPELRLNYLSVYAVYLDDLKARAGTGG